MTKPKIYSFSIKINIVEKLKKQLIKRVEGKIEVPKKDNDN